MLWLDFIENETETSETLIKWTELWMYSFCSFPIDLNANKERQTVLITGASVVFVDDSNKALEMWKTD